MSGPALSSESAKYDGASAGEPEAYPTHVLNDKTISFLKVSAEGAASQPKHEAKRQQHGIKIPQSKSKRRRNGALGGMNTLEPNGNSDTVLKYNSNKVLKQDQEVDGQDYYVHLSQPNLDGGTGGDFNVDVL